MKIGLGGLAVSLAVLSLAACSGGSSSDSGSGSVATGTKWYATAAVTKEGCDARVTGVTQAFTIVSQADGSLGVDTTLVVIPAHESGGVIDFGFEESTAGCTHTYTGEIAQTTETAATVTLSSKENCGGRICENTWAGTATKIQ